MPYRKGLFLFILIGIFVGFNAHSWPLSIKQMIPSKDLPKGWSLIEGPQIFTKETLFEHINGQAELFLTYGFQKSVFAIYQNNRESRDQIELDIYDMGGVVQAFGIFSRFRDEDRPMGIGLDSYLDPHSFFFYKGRYFIMAYSVEPNPNALRDFSKSVELKISDFSPPPREISCFPKEGLKSGSIQYFPEAILGYQFLKRGFHGIYRERVEEKDNKETRDKEFKLFLSIFKNPQEATGALKSFKGRLTQKGEPLSKGLLGLKTKALKGEDPYHGNVLILQKGLYLLGAVGFDNNQYAEDRLTEFIKRAK